MFSSTFPVLLYARCEAVPEVLTAMLLMTPGGAAVPLYLAFAVFSESLKLPGY